MSTRLPTKTEWQEAGFTVPAELCHDERELQPHEMLAALCRGESDPISDLANDIIDAVRHELDSGGIFDSVEMGNCIEEEIRGFLMRIINEAERKKSNCDPDDGGGAIDGGSIGVGF